MPLTPEEQALVRAHRSDLQDFQRISGRRFTDEEKLRHARRWEEWRKEPLDPNAWNPFLGIILLAIFFTAILVGSLYASIYLNKTPTKKRLDQNPDSEHSDSENAFAVSSGRFLDAREMLEGLGSGGGWAGSSGAGYAGQAAEFRLLIGQIAEAGQGVDSIVQIQAEQVSQGRQTLENIVNGLQLAIPVSESLYFSGPAGLALSFNFQMAVASSGVGEGTDTANTMNENAQRHAERLTALAQIYDQALRSISSGGPGRVAQRESSCAPLSASMIRIFGDLGLSAGPEKAWSATVVNGQRRQRAASGEPSNLVNGAWCDRPARLRKSVGSTPQTPSRPPTSSQETPPTEDAEEEIELGEGSGAAAGAACLNGDVSGVRPISRSAATVTPGSHSARPSRS